MSKNQKPSEMVVHTGSAPKGVATLEPGATLYVEIAPGLPAPAITYEQFSGACLRALRTVMTQKLRARMDAAEQAQRVAQAAADRETGRGQEVAPALS